MSKNIIIRDIGKKKLLALIVLGMLGVILLSFSKCSADSGAKESEGELTDLDPSAYAREIEEKVESLCNKIDGVGSTYAVVTLRGGYKAIYATDSQSGSSNSKNLVLCVASRVTKP